MKSCTKIFLFTTLDGVTVKDLKYVKINSEILYILLSTK